MCFKIILISYCRADECGGQLNHRGHIRPCIQALEREEIGDCETGLTTIDMPLETNLICQQCLKRYGGVNPWNQSQRLVVDRVEEMRW